MKTECQCAPISHADNAAPPSKPIRLTKAKLEDIASNFKWFADAIDSDLLHLVEGLESGPLVVERGERLTEAFRMLAEFYADAMRSAICQDITMQSDRWANDEDDENDEDEDDADEDEEEDDDLATTKGAK